MSSIQDPAAAIATAVHSVVKKSYRFDAWTMLVTAKGATYVVSASECMSGYIAVNFIGRLVGEYTPNANTYRGMTGAADPHGRKCNMRKGPRRTAIERAVRAEVTS